MSAIASLDRAIGERIRARRTELGLTQDQLAAALGVSYQQIQKFEGGASRIAAVQLLALAQRLDVPIAYFLPGTAADDKAPAEQGPRQRTALQLTRAFAEIKDEGVRVAIAALARAVAERAEPDAPPESFSDQD